MSEATDPIAIAVGEAEKLKRLADGALEQISDEQFFAAPGDVDNSLAVMVKHLAGNMRSRWTDFLTTDGEKPDRDRDTEFELREGESRASLSEAWEAGWRVYLDALRSLRPDDVARTVTIRGEPHTVLEAVQRQATHYAYHVGQIVYLARHHAGARWRSLSIPKGESRRFNENPSKYLR